MNWKMRHSTDSWLFRQPQTAGTELDLLAINNILEDSGYFH